MSTRLMLSDASFEALKVQVGSIEKSYMDLKAEVASLDNKMERGFSVIADKLDQKNKTPWGLIYTALGFILSVCITIGGLAYMPIKNDMVRIETTQNKILEETVVRDRRIWDRVIENRDRLNVLEGKFSK